jgi:hypothetical protein
MTTSVNYYAVRCLTESAWVNRWDVAAPTVCPNNNTHSIDSALTTIIDTVSSSELPMARDAFGRFRTCEQQTVLEYSHLFGLNAQVETFAATGSGTYLADATFPAIISTVGATIGTVKSQTRKRGIYQPGKSLLIYITGILNNNANAVGCVSRMGYYDDTDGYYFEYSNPTTYIVERSNSVDTRIAQANWNQNIFSTLDISKAQIFFFDIAWLGVGKVRAGIQVDGVVIYLHSFYHSNSLTKPYINLPSLPLRCEILNTGSSQQGKLMHICGTVLSEGGYTYTGNVFSVDNGIVAKTIGTTMYPIIAVRMKSAGGNYKRNIFVNNFGLIVGSGVRIRVVLYLFKDQPNASFLTGPSWVDVHSTSSCEYDVLSTAINLTNGFVVYTAYVAPGVDNILINVENVTQNMFITTNISGLTDYLVLCAQSFATNKDVNGTLTWRELV